jgi:hypothetical protein
LVTLKEKKDLLQHILVCRNMASIVNLKCLNTVGLDVVNVSIATFLRKCPNPSDCGFYHRLIRKKMEGSCLTTMTDAKGIVVHTQDINILWVNTIRYL